MKRVIFQLVVLTMVVSSCSKEITTITPANQTQNLGASGLIYSLPKTILLVKVQSINTIHVAGPYAQYSQKYLGISDVRTESSSLWHISGIELLPQVQPDMNSLFVVDPSPNFSINFLHLDKEGLIIPISDLQFGSFDLTTIGKPSNKNGFEFSDLSPTPFIATEQTTHYSKVFQDSTFVRVPVHKSVVIEKSLEDKAREAADFIFTLRKRRLELLSGDADFVAEGKAAETVLNEISRLENEYVSLFVGKNFRYTYTNFYDFTPSDDIDGASILFRFSSTKGILPVSDLSGSPILVTLSSDNSWNNIELLNNLSVEKGIQRTDAVYYRIPVPINVKISSSQTEIVSRTLTFYQFGPLVRIPSKFISNGKGILK